MATKSYSKHKEFKEFSSSGTKGFSDAGFEKMKAELLPKNSKLKDVKPGEAEYFYEYKEEKHPSGKYDRKDLHSVEQYSIPPKTGKQEHSSYYYEKEERSLPAIESSYHHHETAQSSTPGYSRIKSKATKELSHNVDELDSLLDDLQRDQERQLYKSKYTDGYTSDTAESSSFDYRKTSTPVKAPSSGYSTLKAERMETSSWGRSPSPAPVTPTPTITRLEEKMFREEKTESRVVPSQVSPAISHPVPAPLCAQCHHPSGTLSRSGTPMNKVTTTVKTYTYEVPADQDPTTVPLSAMTAEEKRYLSDTRTTTTSAVPPSPSLGCQYCSHCNTRIVKDYAAVERAPVTSLQSATHKYDKYESTTDERYHGPTNERTIFPKPANEIKVPVISEPAQNGHGPYGPKTYKWSETSYSEYNTTEKVGGDYTPPFPRPTTPSPGTQQPPKRLDDLLEDFPEARFPTQPDGVVQRKVEILHESKSSSNKAPSKNVAGPAVYYPPNSEPLAKKEASAAYQAGGGAYAAGRGMYEYESGEKSKSKVSEKKTAVPICLPLCCAMPCSIM